MLGKGARGNWGLKRVVYVAMFLLLFDSLYDKRQNYLQYEEAEKYVVIEVI